MTIKITLITPPDIFENDNESILILNLPEAQQTLATDWLGKLETDKNFNIYFYQNETEVPWILHTMAVSKYKYIDIDASDGVASYLASYILAKPNTYYSTTNPDFAALYSYVNQNRVRDIVEFFERTLGAE